MVTVNFELLNENAKLPYSKYKNNACLDLHATENITVDPGGRIKVPTGLRAGIPIGFELLVRPRSGLAIKNGVTVLNTPGTIDSNYRGEIFVILINLGNETFRVSIGDRIAQCCVKPVTPLECFVVDGIDVESTERGNKGFGSSGV